MLRVLYHEAGPVANRLGSTGMIRAMALCGCLRKLKSNLGKWRSQRVPAWHEEREFELVNSKDSPGHRFYEFLSIFITSGIARYQHMHNIRDMLDVWGRSAAKSLSQTLTFVLRHYGDDQFQLLDVLTYGGLSDRT